MTSAYLLQPLRPEPLRLPQGVSESDVLAQAIVVRQMLWRTIKDEDQRLQQLEDYCTHLCDGHRASGERLATRTLWTPGPGAQHSIARSRK